MKGKYQIKKIINILIYLLCIPLVLLLGVFVFKDRQYVAISVTLAVLVLVGFFLAFERKQTTIKEISVVTLMIAFSVVGRLIFAAVPSFKPIAAIVIISGIAFGYEAGFMVGSLSALLSNFYFGQGPWTPFQMVAFGMIGCVAGLIFRKKQKIWLIILYGAISGILYSLFMDIWTTISIDNAFTFSRYIAVLATGVPYMIMYAICNVLFLLILTKPMLKQIERIKKKYRIFESCSADDENVPEDF